LIFVIIQQRPDKYFKMTENNQFPQPDNEFEEEEESEDKLNTVLAILSFVIPLVGIIIYFSNRKTKPNTAKSALIAALLGLLVGLILEKGIY
jgi:hypothetical protein